MADTKAWLYFADIATTGGNANGAICAFPFTYNGLAYSACIPDPNRGDWCGTTPNYDRDLQWGICDTGSPISSTGNRVHFSSETPCTELLI